MRTYQWILCLCITPALLAQAPARVGVGVVERKMTLADAIEAAMKNNLDLEIERTNVATASQLVKAAKGVFDGVFRWQPSLESRDTPTSSVLLGANGKLSEDFHSENFSFSQRMPWAGAALTANFNNTRQSTTNPFAGLNPYVTSTLQFQYQQPLLRNRATDRDRTEIQVRSRNVEISEKDLELRVINVVTQVEQAYWSLVAARQDVQVKADGVDWAREQLARNQRMIDSGTLAKVELAAAEAELERRLDTYYSSLTTLTEAENNLKLLISSSREDDLWNDAIVPADERDLDYSGTDDVREAVTIAVGNRPELQQLGLRRQNNDVQKTLAQDQLKPQMNLVAGYTIAGLAGSQSSGSNPFTANSQVQLDLLNKLAALNGLDPLPPPSTSGIPPSLVGGYGSTLSGLFGANYPTYSVGLTMDWNTRNRTAEANLSQTAIAEKRLDLQRSQMEQVIAAQVRNAMQALQTASQRIVAAEASARAAKEKLDSETRLFQNGESTNFLVLTRQNEYSDSRLREVLSRLDYNRAVSRLRQAMGSSLEAHQITVR